MKQLDEARAVVRGLAARVVWGTTGQAAWRRARSTMLGLGYCPECYLVEQLKVPLNPGRRTDNPVGLWRDCPECEQHFRVGV